MAFPQGKKESEQMSFKPENELGVMVLFAQQAQSVGYEILRVQATFPDMLVRKDDIDYEVEAEYLASNFKAHGHPPHKCDIILCWENDYPESPLPVLSLSDSSWKDQEIVVPSKEKREILYWKNKAQQLQKHLDALESNQVRLEASPDDIVRLLKKIGSAANTLRVLAKSPLLTHSEIAEIAGTSRSLVGYHIRRLIEEGLVAESDIYGYEILIDLPAEFLMQEQKGNDSDVD
jgi:DNA-binding transcriptional ArsR family regulator